MSLLEKATAHYSDAPLRDLYVPEWDEKIYWRPYTMAQVTKVHGVFSGDGNHTAAMVMVRALKEDGSPHFEVGFDTLNKLKSDVDGQVLLRVFEAMNARPEAETAGKK